MWLAHKSNVMWATVVTLITLRDCALKVKNNQFGSGKISSLGREKVRELYLLECVGTQSNKMKSLFPGSKEVSE